ncbi:MAG: hypothetical protein ACLU6Y_05925 [Ruminococcus sp.]
MEAGSNEAAGTAGVNKAQTVDFSRIMVTNSLQELLAATIGNSVTQKCFHTRIRAGSTFHLYRLSEQITELIFRQAPGGCDWHMLLQENGITVHSVHKKHLAECHQ